MTRDRAPSSSGWIVPLAIAVVGPPTPRAVQDFGGLSSVISSVGSMSGDHAPGDGGEGADC